MVFELVSVIILRVWQFDCSFSTPATVILLGENQSITQRKSERVGGYEGVLYVVGDP